MVFRRFILVMLLIDLLLVAQRQQEASQYRWLSEPSNPYCNIGRCG